MAWFAMVPHGPVCLSGGVQRVVGDGAVRLIFAG